MKRVYIVVEGQTEEAFVQELLQSALHARGIHATACLLGRPGHKGGNVKYARVRGDVLRLLKQDRGAYCSTMLDFYGLGTGFPNTPLPPGLTSRQQVQQIESGMKADICAELGATLRPELRFLPYLQLHEYEALLFSNPATFAGAIYEPKLSSVFQQIRDAFPTPEDINDSPISAPSKRVLQVLPSYKKPLYGALAAIAIGIDVMRRECPHFHEWIAQLEALAYY